MKNLTVLLIGAPNCGKSSLFCALTSRRSSVANRAGVTVKERIGRIRKKHAGSADRVILSDLPPIFSLFPRRKSERITLERLGMTRFDAIINVLDVRSLQGELSLTLELAAAFPRTPIVVAANKIDRCSAEGISFDESALSRALSLPVAAVSASKREGLRSLCAVLQKAIHEGRGSGAPCALSAEEIASRSVFFSPFEKAKREKRERRAAAADRALSSGLSGIIFFILALFSVFWLAFGVLGRGLTAFFTDAVVFPLKELAVRAIEAHSQLGWLSSLISKGILTGVCAFLSFLPSVLLLGFGLALLEECGYLSRAARLFDAPLRRIGASGETVVPALLGLGCTVSALLDTRNLRSPRERRACALLLPLISCSARSPLYLSFCGSLSGGSPVLLCLGLYLVGIVCFLLGISVLSFLFGRRPPAPAAEALPEYRAPRLAVITKRTLERGLRILKRAGTVVFLGSVFTWLASSFSLGAGFVEDSSESLLVSVSSVLSPLFAPLGFDDPRLVASLMSGLSAKESAISSISILFEAPSASLDHLIACGAISKAGACAFLVFFSLYAPCFPTMTAIYEESERLSSLALSCASCFSFAYACALITYRTALFFGI